MSLHKFVHSTLKDHAPEPVAGTALGAVGGTAVGTVATGAALHGAGVTVGTVVASASTVGVGATASALCTVAAPIILPAIGCCAVYGAASGLANWIKGGFKNPYK